METKQLFRIYCNNLCLTNWLNVDGLVAQSDGDVNWIYSGIEKDFKTDVVYHAIDNAFEENEVYLYISPINSFLVSKSIAVEEIGKFLHKKNIGITNKSMTKLIEFTTFGVFRIGIIRKFPKDRIRPENAPLEVAFHANIVDNNTSSVLDIIRSHLKDLSKELSKDYGGFMEHLWIDLELVETSKSYPFRFQKRVNIPTKNSYTEFYTYNVGHYSIKPDFEKLRELQSKESICAYIFGLLYESTQILVDKQKMLKDFDVQKFRLDFCNWISNIQ